LNSVASPARRRPTPATRGGAALRHTPSDLYARVLDRIDAVSERGGDIGPLVNALYAKSVHLADSTFEREWARIHARDSALFRSRHTRGGAGLRHLELMALMALLYRRGVLEERRWVDDG
jgi:hypothetical protein